MDYGRRDLFTADWGYIWLDGCRPKAISAVWAVALVVRRLCMCRTAPLQLQHTACGAYAMPLLCWCLLNCCSGQDLTFVYGCLDWTKGYGCCCCTTKRTWICTPFIFVYCVFLFCAVVDIITNKFSTLVKFSHHRGCLSFDYRPFWLAWKNRLD